MCDRDLLSRQTTINHLIKGVQVLLQSRFKRPCSLLLRSFELKQLSHHPLEGLRGEPQHLHQVVLPVAHPEPKHHISHIVPAQHHSAQPHQADPQQDQDPQRGGQHEVSQEKTSAHGGTGGMAGREGVAVHRKGGEHVHAIM